jgi:hypothetical protein
MGHSVYNRYNMKLNKQLSSYNDLIDSINKYLKECRHIETTAEYPGEGYRATIEESKGETVVSFFNYKSCAPVYLSHDLIARIKSNINSNPAEFYYYLEGEQYSGWDVSQVYGKAEIVLDQYTTRKVIDADAKALLNSFHSSLYSSFNESIQLTDTASIINCIKMLSQKAYAIDYLATKRERPAYDPCTDYCHRFLIPLFRKKDKSVILASYDFFKLELVLYRMRKPEKSYEKDFEISYFDMNFIEFIENKKDIIIKNLTHPNMVSIHNAMEYYKNNSYYGKTDGYYTHRRKGVVKLFDDNGPFIDVTKV